MSWTRLRSKMHQRGEPIRRYAGHATISNEHCLAPKEPLRESSHGCSLSLSSTDRIRLRCNLGSLLTMSRRILVLDDRMIAEELTDTVTFFSAPKCGHMSVERANHSLADAFVSLSAPGTIADHTATSGLSQ
jgi:hypothetical protein